MLLLLESFMGKILSFLWFVKHLKWALEKVQAGPWSLRVYNRKQHDSFLIHYISLKYVIKGSSILAHQLSETKLKTESQKKEKRKEGRKKREKKTKQRKRKKEKKKKQSKKSLDCIYHSLGG